MNWNLMRILYVANSQFPSRTAHTMQISRMCEAFSKMGHEVMLYGFKSKFYKNNKDLFKFYNVKKKFGLTLVKNPKLNYPLTRDLHLIKNFKKIKGQYD